MDSGYTKELKNSFIDETIIALNFKELQGNTPYEYLLYGLDKSERTNTGTLREKWLKKYSHLYAGGWWCSGIDLLTLQDSDWGCFKPYEPRIIQGKPIKYEHPPQIPTEVFALKVSYKIGLKIAQRYGLEDTYDATIPENQDMNQEDKGFWGFVLQNPRIDISIVEGAKKAGCLLSAGYAAVGLPGIHSGYRSKEDRKELIPQLKLFCHQSRLFNFVFDQDQRWKTQLEVNRAIRTTAQLIEAEDCLVFVAAWDYKDGKGIDDLAGKKGEASLHEVLETVFCLEDWQEEKDDIKILKRRHEVLEFVDATFGKKLRFNELSEQIELNGEPIKLDDQLIDKIIREYRVECSAFNLYGTFISIAKENRYHPVVEYLKNCYNLGQFGNIDNLSTRYFKTNNPLYDFCVKKWLIAAVARAFEPGCKVDYALVLKQQSEGTGKSSFFRALGGDWFDDNLGADLESKKALMSLHQCWIQEWGEIERVSRGKEVSIVKAFITRQHDRYVPPYAREPETKKRRFVFCGTTNEDEFLRSATGDRRFLVLEMDDKLMIDTTTLWEERDALWASAVREYLQGKKNGEQAWDIPREILLQIMEQNQQSRVTHPWEERIVQAIESRKLELVNVNWLLTQVLEIPLDRQFEGTGQAVSTILRGLGWRRVKNPIVFPITGEKVRCWEKGKVLPGTHEITRNTLETHMEQGVCSGSKPDTAKVSDSPEHTEHQNLEKLLEKNLEQSGTTEHPPEQGVCSGSKPDTAKVSDSLEHTEHKKVPTKKILNVGQLIEWQNLLTGTWQRTRITQFEHTEGGGRSGYILSCEDGFRTLYDSEVEDRIKVIEERPWYEQPKNYRSKKKR